MAEVARNAPCPCGSGLKYKRCCLHRPDLIRADVAEAERVWGRMQDWAMARFRDQLMPAVKQHLRARGVGNDERPANEHDLSLALCLVLIDRRLADGSTPARLYAQLPDLPTQEREMAERIAACGLGVHRVLDACAGEWVELQDALDGTVVRVSSPLVSRETVRWHVLLCRVMRGGPMPSLWGAAAFFEPAEEIELSAELQRIAIAQGLGDGVDGRRAALRVGATELVCFRPPSRDATRVPYTLEGDPVVLAEATWRLDDPRAVASALDQEPELAYDGPTDDGAGVAFDWMASRRELLARRPPLPPGALAIESSAVQLDERGRILGGDATTLGTFTLRADRLEFFGMSRQRLDGAVTLVERVLGPLVGRARRRVQEMDAALGKDRQARSEGAAARGVAGGSRASDARMLEYASRRWLDDPNERLGGLSPREAAARGEHLAEVERQLRSTEHSSARDRPDGRPARQVTRLRAELGLGDGRLAA